MNLIQKLLSKIFKKKEEKIINKIYVDLEHEEIFEEEKIKIHDFSDIDKITKKILEMDWKKVKKVFENLVKELEKEEVKNKLILDPFRKEAEKIYNKYSKVLEKYNKIKNKIEYKEKLKETDEIAKNILPLDSYINLLEKKIEMMINYIQGLVDKINENNYKKVAKDIIDALKNFKILKDKELLKILKNISLFNRKVKEIEVKLIKEGMINVEEMYRSILNIITASLREKKINKNFANKIRKVLYSSYYKFKRGKLSEDNFRKILNDALAKIENI